MENNSFIEKIKLDIPIIFLLYSLVSFIGELMAFYAFFMEYISSSFLLIIHILFTMIFILLSFMKKDYMRDKGRYIFYFSMLFATMGILGTVIAFLTLISYQFFSIDQVDFTEWLAALFPEKEENQSEDLYEKIIFGQNDISENISTEPFQDIMVYGTIRQKQLALVKMTRYFVPEFAPIILSSLQDNNNSIRVQAAAAVAKLEDKFLNNYKILEQRTIDNPEDILELRNFAEACNEYANSNLLDADRAKFIRHKIIQVYGKCIRFLPGDYKLRLFLAQIYLIDGNFDLALRSLIESIKKAPLMFPSMIRINMEILYKMKEFREMQILANEQISFALDYYKEDYELVSLLNLWKNGYMPT